MNDRLNRTLERLAETPTDRSLEFMEVEVSRGIGRWRGQARTASALASVRVASIGLALAMGVAFGGINAVTNSAAPRQVGAFAVAADLAPSTLLEGGR